MVSYPRDFGIARRDTDGVDSRLSPGFERPLEMADALGLKRLDARSRPAAGSLAAA